MDALGLCCLPSAKLVWNHLLRSLTLPQSDHSFPCNLLANRVPCCHASEPCALDHPHWRWTVQLWDFLHPSGPSHELIQRCSCSLVGGWTWRSLCWILRIRILCCCHDQWDVWSWCCCYLGSAASALYCRLLMQFKQTQLFRSKAWCIRNSFCLPLILVISNLCLSCKALADQNSPSQPLVWWLWNLRYWCLIWWKWNFRRRLGHSPARA